MLKVAETFKPDLIRVHSPYYLGIASLTVGRLLGIPTVACFHHSFETFLGARWTEMKLLGKFTHVITVSEFSRKQLISLDARLSKRSTVIYNGISEVFRPKQDDMSSWKRKQGLPVENPLFVTTGSLIPRKNILWLVDLMAAWIQARNPGVLVIAGDGPERTKIARKIASRGLDRHVVLWGAVDDETLVLLLQAADVFLFPSLIEGFGFAAAEALACGTPVIVSDRGALPEVVKHDHTGFVLPLHHGFTPWIEAMKILISDSTTRRTMAKAGLADIRERFYWDRAGLEVIGVYEQVIKRGPGYASFP
jgi:glycosyltransferase involved in cell wall biosynthesis